MESSLKIKLDAGSVPCAGSAVVCLRLGRIGLCSVFPREKSRVHKQEQGVLPKDKKSIRVVENLSSD